MIKYNEAGNIILATFEVKPTNPGEQEALKKFSALPIQQRAELIELGFEYLNHIYQEESDRVAGA